MKKSTQKLPSWHRLDNAANVFPLISHKNFSNVFRLSVQLKKPVLPEVLQNALALTLPNFGNFNFRIRRGFFWYYFEPVNVVPKVQEESLRPCFYIDTKNKNHLLMRVFYYKNRISLEVFHAITDGTGATNFLKALTTNYLQLLDGTVVMKEQVRLKVHSELEDSYVKYSLKKSTKPEKLPKALRMRGKLIPAYKIGVIHTFLSVEEALKVSKSYELTLTEYLMSVYIWSIYQSHQVDQLTKKPIHIASPVNLRRFFESTTNMNFFSHIAVRVDTHQNRYDFNELAQIVKQQFRSEITKEKMQNVLSHEVSMRQNLVTRIFPLALKNHFVKWIHLKSVQSYTSTMSNVGKIEMPEPYKDEVDYFELLMNTSANDPMKCAICSYEDKLVVTLSSQLVHTDVQKIFLRKLSSDGLEVTIESNGAFYEVL